MPSAALGANMYAQIVVPLDGGAFSARALGPAVRLASACDAPLRLVAFSYTETYLTDLSRAIAEIAEQVDHPNKSIRVELSTDFTESIAEEVEAEPGSIVCMSSVGRPHAAPILGSVAEALLRRLTTPLLLVGPASHADFLDLERPITVCVDGSPSSESILPIVASWAIVFHLDTRVVHVVPSRHRDDPLADESEYAKRIAASLEVEIGRRVSYDVLRGDAVADVVANDARVQHAGIVAAATHGATGLHRVVAGSVAMGIVHHAPCPVLAYRPLEYLR